MDAVKARLHRFYVAAGAAAGWSVIARHLCADDAEVEIGADVTEHR